jgi:hypothetical protein
MEHFIGNTVESVASVEAVVRDRMLIQGNYQGHLTR